MRRIDEHREGSSKQAGRWTILAEAFFAGFLLLVALNSAPVVILTALMIIQGEVQNAYLAGRALGTIVVFAASLIGGVKILTHVIKETRRP